MADTPLPLAGRTAVISGASAGIGEAIARLFVSEGANVVVNARRKDRLDNLVGELNQDRVAAHAVPGDIAEPAVITQLAAAGPLAFGAPADLFVVNAGRGLPGSILSSDIEQWENLLRTNIIGAFQMMRVAGNSFVERRKASPNTAEPLDIVVIGSCVGRNIAPASSTYSSTKFAINATAEALRRELAPHRIRVTLVEPGIVHTEFHEATDYGDEFYSRVEEKMGPIIRPDDIARSIAFIVAQPAHVHINNVAIRSVRQEYP